MFEVLDVLFWGAGGFSYSLGGLRIKLLHFDQKICGFFPNENDFFVDQKPFFPN
jgi:hypothetical protein